MIFLSYAIFVCVVHYGYTNVRAWHFFNMQGPPEMGGEIVIDGQAAMGEAKECT